MKTNKLFFLSIIVAICLLFSSNLSAQYWRNHVQGISFLVPKGIAINNTAEEFTGEHTDFKMGLIPVPITDPSEADNFGLLASMITSSEDFTIYEEATKTFKLKGFDGLTMQGTNGFNEMYICLMVDKNKKNIYITVIEALNENGEVHAKKIFSSFE